MPLATKIEHEDSIVQPSEIPLKLSLGLNPEEAEVVLGIASECRSLTAEDLMFVEEAAWENAFCSWGASSTFVKAHVVNDDEENIVAFASFGKITGEQDYYELYSIVVSDSFQSIGIGSLLLDEVDRQVELHGGKMLFCEIPESKNFMPMQYFLKAVGYDIHSRHYKFFIPNKGNLVYARSLEGLVV